VPRADITLRAGFPARKRLHNMLECVAKETNCVQKVRLGTAFPQIRCKIPPI